MLDNKDTYPLKDLFKALEFRFERIDGIQAWRPKQTEVAIDAIKKIIEEWGWSHSIYKETVDKKRETFFPREHAMVDRGSWATRLSRLTRTRARPGSQILGTAVAH